MNEVVNIAIVVVVTFLVIVGVWRLYLGYYPGSKWIIEDPPITHNGLDGGQARFMFFYTTWCPWSTKAWGPWKTFKQQLKNNPSLYGGKEIIFEEVNAEADKGKAALYNVKAYPTFKVETTDKVFLLQAVPDPLTFDTFLIGTLGKKTAHKSPAS